MASPRRIPRTKPGRCAIRLTSDRGGMRFSVEESRDVNGDRVNVPLLQGASHRFRSNEADRNDFWSYRMLFEAAIRRMKRVMGSPAKPRRIAVATLAGSR